MANHFSFTPERQTKFTKAWQRRPATPYAARNRTQKIWKRQPQAFPIDSATSYRKDERDSLQAIKRLKKEHSAVGAAKDYTHTKKAEVLATPTRRRHPRRYSREAGPFRPANSAKRRWSARLSTTCHESFQGSAETADDTSPQTEKNVALGRTKKPRSCTIAECLIEAEVSSGSKEAKTGDQEVEADSGSCASAAVETVVGVADADGSEAAATMHTGRYSFAYDDHETSNAVTTEAALASDPAQKPSCGHDMGVECCTYGVLTQFEAATLDMALAIPSPANQSLNDDAAQVEDTDYLKQFLQRTKAKQEADNKEQLGTMPQDRSKKDALTVDAKQRKPLSPLSPNSSSPRKSTRNRSPAKPEEQDYDSTKFQDVTVSARPKKVGVLANTSMPLRKAKGNEFIFGHWTEAQQLALSTRQNTKINRGEAVMPKSMLQALSSEAGQDQQNECRSSPRKARPSAKVVSWESSIVARSPRARDAYKPMAKTSVITTATTETEPKVMTERETRSKKVKRLGTVNGTPAPKKVGLGIEPPSSIPLSNRRVRRK